MKNLLLGKSLLAICFLFLAFGVSAQKGDPNLDSRNSHFFTVSLSAGASGYAMTPSYTESGFLKAGANYEVDTLPIVLSPDELNITPFVGGSFGIGYEYQGARGFWMSLGLEGQILSGRLHHTDSIHCIEGVMDGNVETGPSIATVEYTLIKWKEIQTNVYVTLPIMFGYKHESGMYFGAGAKLGYGLYNRINGNFGYADCNLKYPGRYPANGIIEDVPLMGVQATDANFMSLPQVNPMVEIGWQGLDTEISKKSRMRFKFALVGELGMLSAYKNRDLKEELFDYALLDGFRPDDLKDFFKAVNSFYSTMPIGLSASDFTKIKQNNEGLPIIDRVFDNFDKPTVLRSWFVGVKATIMFEMPKRKHCNCLQNNIITPWEKRIKDRGVE